LPQRLSGGGDHTQLVKNPRSPQGVGTTFTSLKRSISVARREQVIENLEIMRSRFSDEKLAKNFQSWNKTMQYYFTDSGEYWRIVLVNGSPEPLQEGQAEDAAIKYEMSTDTFVAITKKELSGMKAYKQGLVKVKAAVPDLMKLQKLE
jgi:hypothetical protein